MPATKRRRNDDSTAHNRNKKARIKSISKTKRKFLDKQMRKMQVIGLSDTILLRTKMMHEGEINQRKAAVSKLNKSKSSISLNAQETMFLNEIFLFSLGNPNLGDRSVLTLLRVCKLWRETIHSCDTDGTYHRMYWYGSVMWLRKGWSSLNWKHLVSVPDQYLKLRLNIGILPQMTEKEMADFRWHASLINDRNLDEFNTNVPLLIAILKKCPQICALDLSGSLCEGLFIIIGLYCKGLDSLSFSWVNIDNNWLRWLVEGGSDTRYAIGGVVKDTLQGLNIMCSPICDDETAFWFSWCTNLTNIDAEKWNISGDGLYHLFTGCTKLETLQVDQYLDEQGRWKEAFCQLIQHNTSIRSISMNDAAGFDDECLMQFIEYGEGWCPDLRKLEVTYNSCSTEMIKKFKAIYPNVRFDGDSDVDDDDDSEDSDGSDECDGSDVSIYSSDECLGLQQ